MHMADALLSPAVGVTMWAASAGTIAYCSGKIRKEPDDRKIPLMGVLGAFLFAAQMINFTIPGTGSSGHLGGGLLLSILLGPYAALLTIASVLVVQALFFADGGLLALGCNIFNIGFIPAFIIYPLVYKNLIGKNPTPVRLTAVTIVCAVLGLQLGPFAVVLQTLFSGISSLPFSTFVLLMQPIHLAIGVVEGLVTASILTFVYKARPELLTGAQASQPIGNFPVRSIVIGFFALSLFWGGFVSWFASENPDGLEWAIKKVTGKEQLAGTKTGILAASAALQEKTAFLPDYNFKKPEAEGKKDGSKQGTSLAGLVGGIITLGLAFIIGAVLRKFSAPQPN